MKAKRIISLLASLAMMVTAVTGTMTVSVVSAADNYATSGSIGENGSWLINSDGVLVVSGTGEINGSNGWGWDEPNKLNRCIEEVVIEDGITSASSMNDNHAIMGYYNCRYASKIILPPSLNKLKGCLDVVSCFTQYNLKDIYIYSKNITDTAYQSSSYPGGITWHIYKDSKTDKSLRNDLGLTDEDIEYIPANEKMPPVENKTAAKLEPLKETSGPAGVASKYEWNETSKTLTFSGKGTIAFTDYYKDYAEETEHIVINSGIVSVNTTKIVASSGYTFGAFYGFTALKDVELPETLKEIGDASFYKTELTKVDLPKTLEKIGGQAFDQSKLEEISFPDSLYSIGVYAFANTKIKSINLHDGMIIGGGAFLQCESLKEVTIPKNCTYGPTIGQGHDGSPSTFQDCTGFEKVVIEKGVTDLSVEAMFINCTALKNVYFYTTDLQSIVGSNTPYVAETSYTFPTYKNITFHVIKGSTTEQTLIDAGYLTADNTVYLADTTALETAITEAEEIETDKYTDESVSAFTKAIENARALLDNMDATQDEVDKAVKAIEDAKTALTEKPDEPSSSDSSNPSDPSNSSDNNNQSQSPNTPATPSTSAPTTATPKPITPPTVTTTAAKPAKVKAVKVKAKKKKLNVSWKKVSGATGYEVQYATNNKFTKGKKTVTVKKNKVTLKRLKSKKKYFVKVRAYKLANGRKYFGKWSKVVKEKTK